MNLQLVEVFSSVQGEGTHVGESALFVRFAQCDLRCRWCDSPNTWGVPKTCRVEVCRASGEFREVPNPIPLDAVLSWLEALELPRHRMVSLTGGEPLLQAAALKELAKRLRARGPRILLETHGLAAEALEEVIEHIDVVSMDWKLASDVRRAGEALRDARGDFHEEHERFLKAALLASEVIVKVVISTRTQDAEIDELVRRVAAVAPEVSLILQPVTPFGPVREQPSAERLLALLARVNESLPQARLIPQTHKLLGLL